MELLGVVDQRQDFPHPLLVYYVVAVVLEAETGEASNDQPLSYHTLLPRPMTRYSRQAVGTFSVFYICLHFQDFTIDPFCS